MGLALHDPASSLSDLTEHRHLPGRPSAGSKPKISPGRYYDLAFRYELTVADEGHRPLRPHQLAILRSTYRSKQPIYDSRHSLPVTDVHNNRPNQRWAPSTEEEEGRELARSEIRLPSDSRGRRPPSLERQEAFSDARTTKKRQRSPDLLDEAELYRLGLLYDNEHERGSGFTLNTIVHNAPVYSIGVRHARVKRSRRAKTLGAAEPGRAELPLDLSFTGLADDDAIARYLISPKVDEITVGGEEEEKEEEEVTSPASTDTAPLTIIYELDSSTHAPQISHCDIEFADSIFYDGDENGDWAAVLCDDEDEQETVEDGGDDDAAPGSPDAWIVLR